MEKTALRVTLTGDSRAKTWRRGFRCHCWSTHIQWAGTRCTYIFSETITFFHSSQFPTGFLTLKEQRVQRGRHFKWPVPEPKLPVQEAHIGAQASRDRCPNLDSHPLKGLTSAQCLLLLEPQSPHLLSLLKGVQRQ